MKVNQEKRYEVTVSLYKHYNELSLKSSAFIWSIVSALTAFYLSHQGVDKIEVSKHIAVTVVGVSSLIYFVSIFLVNNLGQEIKSVFRELGLEYAPSIFPLQAFLTVNAIAMLFIAGILLIFL